jgi:hypothetical protein
MNLSFYLLLLPRGSIGSVLYLLYCRIVGGIEVNAQVRTSIYCILGLFGIVLFTIGGSLIIWVLHILMWYPASSDFINHLPSDIAGMYIVATPLGLFLVGFSILLIAWSGAGLSFNSQTVLALGGEEQEDVEGTLSVKAHCPHCKALYLYRFAETESDRTVTCQNCGRRFEVGESFDNTDAIPSSK